MHRIVIGVDFSESSSDTARWGCRFLEPDGQAVLAHVVAEETIPAFLRELAGALTSRREVAEAQAEERLEELAHSLPCDIAVRVARGRPAATLAALADELDADLLAIGPRGHRASRLGTTAEQLVRSTDRPVLVVRDPPAGDPRRLLLAVDASPRAPDVLRWGRRLMARFGAAATVLHVTDPEILAGLHAPPEGSAERAGSERALDAARAWLAEQAREEGLPEDATTITPVFGSPVHEIASRTEGGAHDLVVMGSRGVGAVRREVFGSVASGVLRAAWSPALIL